MSSEDGAPAPFQIDRPSDASQVDNMTPFADSLPTTVAQWAPKGVRASDADLRRVMAPSMQTPKPALLGGDAPSSAARPRRLRRASGAFLANRGGGSPCELWGRQRLLLFRNTPMRGHYSAPKTARGPLPTRQSAAAASTASVVVRFFRYLLVLFAICCLLSSVV